VYGADGAVRHTAPSALSHQKKTKNTVEILNIIHRYEYGRNDGVHTVVCFNTTTKKAQPAFTDIYISMRVRIFAKSTCHFLHVCRLSFHPFASISTYPTKTDRR